MKSPVKTLSLFDSTCIIVGIIIGAGIYETTPTVAGCMGGWAGTMAVWLFFLATGAALFRLRRIEPGLERRFHVPAYPLIPILFCTASAFMLYSSASYAFTEKPTGLLVLVGVIAFTALFYRSVPPRSQEKIK